MMLLGVLLALAQTPFEADFQSFRNGAPLSFESMIHARQFHYVFVGGFLNEGIPAYFEDLRGELIAQGVPTAQITSIFPSSQNGVVENADGLLVELQALRGPLPKVVLAHSKGAVEALAAALSEPQDFFREVTALYLLQGAILGSPLSDCIEGECKTDQNHLIPLAHRFMFWLTKNTGRLLDPLISEGFESLTTWEATSLFDELLDQGDFDGLPIYYIRSTQKPELMSEMIDCSGWYLHANHGANDGMVTLAAQRLPGVGEVIANLKADHSDLVLTPPMTSKPKEYRVAFMRAILEHLYLL